MFSSPPNFPTNRFLKSFYRYFCFSRREASFTFTKDNICEILGKFSRYKINIFLSTEFSANESIFHHAYDQPEGKRKELFDPFSLFFEEQQRERKIWGDVSRVTGDIDYPKATPAPRSRPSGLDAWNGFTGGRNPGRDRLIGKLIEKEYIRNTNRWLWLYGSWTKKKRKKEKNIGKRIETNLVQPRTFLQTFDRRWSVSKDRTSARDNRSRRGRGNRKRSDIEMDANSRNWQTTRSYRWMKTPPDPRRNTSSRVFNVVLLFSPEKRRKNVLTSREHGFHCINFTVMIMISLVETLVIFRFEGEEFPFIVFVSRRRSRRSVNAPRLPLGIGRIPRACSPSRSRNFS